MTYCLTQFSQVSRTSEEIWVLDMDVYSEEAQNSFIEVTNVKP